MKIAIISGSHRPESQSGRVGRFLEGRLKALNSEMTTYLLDLGQTPLPFWDESMWGKEGVAASAWQAVSEELESCDAVILVAAEWNGTAPAALKNFFHYASTKELGHKPALIAGVSASLNGAYPIAELRSSGYKNCKLTYIPDHLIFRHVGEILVDNPSDDFKDQDSYMRERSDYSLNVLLAYADALKKVRETGVTDTEKFAFGM